MSEEIDKVFNNADIHYKSLIKKIASKETILVLDKVASFFGKLTGLFFGMFFLSAITKINNQAWMLYISIILFISAGIWVSIKWFTRYKNFAIKFLVDYTRLFLAFFLMPILDWLVNSNITELFYRLVSEILQPLSITLPNVDNLFLMSIIIFFIYELMLIFYWVISTTIFAPIAFLSFLIVLIVVRLSWIIDKYFGKDPLTGTCFILLGVTFGYQLL